MMLCVSRVHYTCIFLSPVFKTTQLGRGVKPLKINFYSSKWISLRPNKKLENILPTNVIFWFRILYTPLYKVYIFYDILRL